MRTRQLLVAAMCTTGLVTGAALAGEVTGPPGKGNVTPKDSLTGYFVNPIRNAEDILPDHDVLPAR